MKKITIVLSAILMFIPICVKAETLQDKYNQLAALQAQYNENKNKKNLTQTQINKLNGEISTISAQIKTTRAEIVQAEQDIENEFNIKVNNDLSREVMKDASKIGSVMLIDSLSIDEIYNILYSRLLKRIVAEA